MAKPRDSYLASKSLRYKLRIVFYLSVLPLLVYIYLTLIYVLPYAENKIDIILYLFAVAFISIAGFLLVKEVFNNIVFITKEVKRMAAGDMSKKIEVDSRDEVSELAEALNELTQGIRKDMVELQDYGVKSSEINHEVQKRVLLLSSLLEISSLISQEAKLTGILKLTIEKVQYLTSSDAAYLFLREAEAEAFYMKAAVGSDSESLLGLSLEQEDRVFSKVIKAHMPLVIDKDNALLQDGLRAFSEKFKLKNTLALPVSLRERVIGILGIGSKDESFAYGKDDTELLNVFSRQIAIAVENDILTHRIEKLEIKDGLTGLYNDAFIRNCLQEEIRRAVIYQRPCALVLLNIDYFGKFHKQAGQQQAGSVLKKVAFLIRDSVTEIDRVARVDNNEFAIVLPERNKRQAQRIAEDIRKKIEITFKEEQDSSKRFTVSGGVSENPLDGIEAEELLVKAKASLLLAKEEGRNRIAGFAERIVCQ